MTTPIVGVKETLKYKMSHQLQVKLTILNFFRKFSEMLARMHHIATKDTGPLTKDNNRIMITGQNRIEKWCDKFRITRVWAKLVTFFQKVIQVL